MRQENLTPDKTFHIIFSFSLVKYISCLLPWSNRILLCVDTWTYKYLITYENGDR